MYRKTLDLNTDATIQRTNTILTKEINEAFINDWTGNLNNGNMWNNIDLIYLGESSLVNLKTINTNTFRKIFLTGKCNMVADTDTFSLIFTNGFNDFLGEAIRPTLNPLDNMYHFCYIMEGWTQYFKIANINTSSNTISNLTINYTALK